MVLSRALRANNGSLRTHIPVAVRRSIHLQLGDHIEWTQITPNIWTFEVLRLPRKQALPQPQTTAPPE